MALKLGAKVSSFTRESINRELYRFIGDDYLWHRHITGITLRPHQRIYCDHLETNPTNLLIASRRLGKSFAVAAKLLKIAATHPNSEINIHSPALEQSKRNLKYMTEMVLNSEILTAMIEKKLGEGIGKEYIEFWNGSVIQAKGQASSVDGLGATAQWWEEVDDMDPAVLFERIYPTGSMLKPGFNYGKWGQCLRVATGTIKGKGNIHNFEHPAAGLDIGFHVLPKWTCWHGVAWGIIPRGDILVARDVLMTPEMFARAYLVLYTESSNFFPSAVVNKCQDPMLLPVTPYLYRKEYERGHYFASGRITCGIDCGAQGTGEHPSKWSITFAEDMGYGGCKWLHTSTWEATANPDMVLEGMMDLIDFFRPARGMGDAFDSTFLFNLNKACFDRKITKVDVRELNNSSGETGWNDWFISPVRFTGPNKHKFFKNLKLMMHQLRFRMPYTVKDEPEYKELEVLKAQFENIKKEDGRLGYDTYAMVRNAIGDDNVDSCALAVYCIETLKGHVRPVGMSIESFGVQFAERIFLSDQNFAGSGFKDSRGGPRNIREFLDRDD